MQKAKSLNFMLMFFSLLLISGHASAATDRWVPISGSVTYNGNPVCAMVLANGQYAFTCSGDGSFSYDVPLDANGNITVQAFCSGRAPYKQVVDSSQAAGLAIVMENANSDASIDVTADLQALNTSRCNIAGNVASNGQPVCSMVLANGQYMFTCSGDGSFSLDVPLDGNGQVTFYVFCAGKQPYKQVYTSNQIDFTMDSDDDGFSIAMGDCNDLDADIHPWGTDRCGDGIDQDCSGVSVHLTASSQV